MAAESTTLARIVAEAKELSIVDEVRLIEQVAPEIERDLTPAGVKPRRSLWGLCSDLGPAPSADQIDEARREAWAGFPREA